MSPDMISIPSSERRKTLRKINWPIQIEKKTSPPGLEIRLGQARIWLAYKPAHNLDSCFLWDRRFLRWAREPFLVGFYWPRKPKQKGPRFSLPMGGAKWH